MHFTHSLHRVVLRLLMTPFRYARPEQVVIVYEWKSALKVVGLKICISILAIPLLLFATVLLIWIQLGKWYSLLLFLKE